MPTMTPTPERWARLTNLLGDARERAGAERAAYLREACADDPTLVAEVERLLTAHQAAESSQRFASGVFDLAPAALAEAAAEAADLGPFITCRAFRPDCTRSFVEVLGARLFRRPLRDPEVQGFLPVFDLVASEGADFDVAARLVLRAMLQSPQFLYHLEDRSAGDRVSPRELASRLAYLVWASTPDEALRAAADDGELATAAGLEAAVRRCGVWRVDTIAELFDVAEVLAKQARLPQGPKLTIITNAGGPGVLTTDALISSGGQLAPLSDDTKQKLDQILPTHWSHGNPIDILGDADSDRYTKTLDIAAQDPNADGLLVILTPQAMTDPTRTAEQLKAYAQAIDKPVLASWMGGANVLSGEAILNQASIPTYPYPDAAAHLFNFMWRYSYNLRALYETPTLATQGGNGFDPAQVTELLQTIQAQGRTLLTEQESKAVLAAYGIPAVQTLKATSEEAAVAHAEQMGYPVVLKLLSETVTHKTDVGGVQLNIANAAAVRQAYQAIETAVTAKVGAAAFDGVTVQPMIDRDNSYELILGSSLDVQFGPVLLFGAGGQMVEVMRDSAIALPPLTTTLARRLIEHTQIYKALQGIRGRDAIDLEQLEQILVRFSQLVVEHPQIKEIDINPLLASPATAPATHTLQALDARVVLHEADIDLTQIPKPAIRPYPTQYVSDWHLQDGRPVTIRPIGPEDEPLIVQFHKTLSEESIFLRYFHLMKFSQRTAHERLTRICFIDYDRQIALVVDYENPETGEHEILGAGRLTKLHGTKEAEFAMLVADSEGALSILLFGPMNILIISRFLYRQLEAKSVKY